MSLSQPVGASLWRASTLPLRIVLWPLRLVLALAIPAFLFAAVLHASVGDVGSVMWEVAYTIIVAAALGALDRVREKLR